ncbi:amino acid adenylation domain-containing protein [Glutamicibacter ardleyensis]|uniref:amino acid adenylation domain-containing protein n=1 Tax=Glutamicibacter ardleyensis TaxID=225894 RepID=UPI003FD34037
MFAKPTKSYLSGGELQESSSGGLTVGSQLLRAATMHGEIPLHFYSATGAYEVTTYKEVFVAAARIVTGFQEAGIAAGDRLIFQSTGSRDYIELFWACALAGVVPVPLTTPKILTASALRPILEIQNTLGSARIAVSLDALDEYVAALSDGEVASDSVISIDALRGHAPSNDFHVASPEDTAVIFFTSGSTGTPKGVVQTNRAVVARELGAIELNRFEKDTQLNWMPLEHAAGVLMAHFRGVVLGSEQVQVDTEFVLADPSQWMVLLSKHRARYSWAPQFAYSLINSLFRDGATFDWDLSSTDFLISGGEMVNAAATAKFQSNLAPYGLRRGAVRPAWGMAETCSGVIYNNRFDAETGIGSSFVADTTRRPVEEDSPEAKHLVTEIGVPIPGLEAAIFDEFDNIAMPGEVGHLLVRGDAVLKEYFGDAQLTEDSFTLDRWFRTGDIGFIRDGAISLVGRNKQRLIINGLNYDASEVEAMIDEIDSVEISYTAVCAIDDAKGGPERVVAFVVLRSGTDRGYVSNAIKDHVRSGLAIALDEVVVLTPEDVPKTNLGKIQRKKLAEKYSAGEFHQQVNMPANSSSIDDDLVNAARAVGVARIATRSADTSSCGFVHDESFLSVGQLEGDYVENAALAAAIEAIHGVISARVWTCDQLMAGVRSCRVTYVPRIASEHYLKATDDRITWSLKEHGYTVNLITAQPMAPVIGTSPQTTTINSISKERTQLLESQVEQWFFEDTLVDAPRESPIAPPDWLILLTDSSSIVEDYQRLQPNQKIVWVTSATHDQPMPNSAAALVRLIVDPADATSYSRLATNLKAHDVMSFDIAHLWNCETRTIETSEQLWKAQLTGTISVQRILAVFAAEGLLHRSFVVFTVNSMPISANHDSYYAGALASYIRSAVDEGHSVKHVELDGRHDDLSHLVAVEIGVRSEPSSVVYRGGQRYLHAITSVLATGHGSTGIEFAKTGFYILTGGLGGVAALIAEYLVRFHGTNVLLLGRSEPNISQSRTLERLKHLAAANSCSVDFALSDLASYNDLQALVRDHSARTSSLLRGVFHFAGVVTDELIVEQTESDLAAAYLPKILGLFNIGELIRREYPSAFVISTSTARALSPGATVSAYVSSSDFGFAYSAYLNQTGIRSICLAWSIWDEIGMSQNLVVKKSLQARGFKSISALDGINSMLYALKAGRPNLYVGLDATRLAFPIAHNNETKPGVVVEVLVDIDSFEENHTAVSLLLDEADVLARSHGFDGTRTLILDEFPIDKNGGIDYAVLWRRIDFLSGQRKLEPPATAAEELILQSCRDVFGIESISATDSLFDIGADSIRIIQLLSALRTSHGVEISHRKFYEDPTVRGLAASLSKPTLDDAVAINADASVVAPGAEASHAADDSGYPLTPQQARQWVMFRLNPDSPYYNNTVTIRLDGTVIAPILKAALQQIVERHEILRTCYSHEGDSPWQIVHDFDGVDLHIPEVDLRGLPAAEREAQLLQLTAEEANKPINLVHDLPIRAQIVLLSATSATLLVTIHHIASDGWSMRVLLNEISATYRDILRTGVSKLPQLSGQYRSFAAKLLAQQDTENYAAQLEFWRSEITNPDNTPELPADFSGPPDESNAGSQVSVEVPVKVAQALKEVAHARDSSLYMVLLSAYTILQHRLTGNDEVRIGTLNANRHSPGADRLIGLFVNTLPFQMSIRPGMALSDLLDEVKTKTITMQDNQDVQFDALVDSLDIERTFNKNPLFQVLFVLQNAQVDELETEGNRWRLDVADNATAKFDLSVQIFERRGRLEVKFEYKNALFRRSTVQRWAENYLEVLAQLAHSETALVQNINIVPPLEGEAILSINETKRPLTSRSLWASFSLAAGSHAESIAVEKAGTRYTYSEIQSLSTRYSAYLRDNGVQAGDAVGVVADRTPEVIIAILAIVRLGATYVPISPTHPDELSRQILLDSGASIVLTNESERFHESARALDLGRYSSTNTDPGEPTADDIAYIMYTSGSTGRPKGVAITHDNILRLVMKTNFVNVTSDDVILQTGSVSFDASTFEIWGALLNGARLHLVNESTLLDTQALRDEVRTAAATILWMSSPLFNQLTDVDVNTFSGLRHMIVGGDVLSPTHIGQVLDAHPDLTITNGYGPTENTTFSTTYEIPRGFDRTKGIPIGRPITNSTAYILNSGLQLQPIGIEGELYVGGRGVAHGYKNNPELTDAVFMDSPFDPTERLYKTGDMARINADLQIEFLGRRDHQIKVRGFRVEATAIEISLKALPGVDDAIIEIEQPPGEHARIVAFISGSSRTSLHGALRTQLPEYMIPSKWHFFDTFPLNKNGKIDRAALRTVPSTDDAPRQPVPSAATSPVEKMLHAIWSDLLNTAEFTAHDNFFRLGGDSIQVIQMTNRIRQAGYQVSTRNVFENQTINELASALTPIHGSVTESIVAAPSHSTLSPIQSWFFENISGNGIQNHWNLPLVIALDRAHTHEDVTLAVRVVTRHHRVLRSTFDKATASQRFEPDAPDTRVLQIDMTSSGGKRSVPDLLARLHQSLDITSGPILAVALLDYGARQEVLFTAHHLVVDGISLRVIAEDLQSVLRGGATEEFALPEPTDDYYSWIQSQNELGISPAILDQLPHWRNVNRRIPERSPGISRPREADMVEKTFILGSEETRALLSVGNVVHGADMKDTLVAALVVAYAELFEAEDVAILMEGHGRDDLDTDIDVSRTVGWFTSIYPVVIPAGSSTQSTTSAVSNARAGLKTVPTKGIGYGILKYISGYNEELDRIPEVSFNYLGAIPRDMVIGDEKYGAFHAGDAPSHTSVELNIFLIDNSLHVRIAIDRRLLELPAYAAFSTVYHDVIARFASDCASPASKTYSPADFEGIELTETELDIVVSEYGGAIENLFPLTPAQQGMLFHQLLSADGSDYFGQITTTVHGSLETARFDTAWATAISESDVMSSAYWWEGLREPVHVRMKSVGFAIQWRDLTHLDSNQQRQKMAEIIAADEKDGFVLSSWPLIRVQLCSLTPTKHVLIISFPHVALDGWSIFVLLRRVLEIYEAGSSATGGSPIGFREYVQWQRAQNLDGTRAFWLQYLKAFRQPLALPQLNPEGPAPAQFEQFEVTLSQADNLQIDDFVRRHGFTLNTLLQGAVALSLELVTGEPDVIFGVTVSGRNADLPGIENIVGLLINTVPLRIQVNPTQAVMEFLSGVQANGFQLLDHDLLESTAIRDLSEIPAGTDLYDVALVFENYPLRADNVSMGSLQLDDFSSHERTNYKLTIVALPGDELTLRFSYMTDDLSPQWVASFAAIMRMALMNLIGEDETLGEFGYVGAEIEETIRNDWKWSPKIAVQDEEQTKFYDQHGHEIYILVGSSRLSPINVRGALYVGLPSGEEITTDPSWAEWMRTNRVPGQVVGSDHEFIYPTGDYGYWTDNGEIILVD